MADTKITALAALTLADPANDVLPIVDTSDHSMAASGTTKQISINNILGASGTATLASATITGDLTVDTSTLKVDSANNRVGIGTATPAATLHVASGNLRLTDNAQVEFGGSTNSISGSNASNFVEIYTNNLSRYRIDSNGVATWSNVGGVASTAMTLNSTGLGVGTSPSYKMHVFSASPILGIQDSSSAAGGVGGTINFLAYTSGTSGANIEAQIKGVKSSASSAGELQFFTSDSSGNSQQRFMVDGSGNVGIGVTPSAWASNRKALQVGGLASAALALNGTSNVSELFFNSLINTSASNVYAVNGRAGLIEFGSGGFGFSIDSGTQIAGAACNFTQAMTLDANGNLILQSSATPATLTTNGQLTVNATSNTNLRFSYRGSDGVTRVANITLA